MTLRSGAGGNDYIEVAPEDLLRELRGVVSRYRYEVLPVLVPEHAVHGTDTAEWVMAEELAGLVGRIEAVKAELMQQPDSADVQRRASELLLAANVLSSVALRVAAITAGAHR